MATKCMFEHHDLHTNKSNFYPLDVVGRGNETQLQVGGDINYSA